MLAYVGGALAATGLECPANIAAKAPPTELRSADYQKIEWRASCRSTPCVRNLAGMARSYAKRQCGGIAVLEMAAKGLVQQGLL
ncbi:hypothetical protein D3C85_1188080 [compost metagenome]